MIKDNNKLDDNGFVDFEGNFLSTISLVASIISFISLITNYFIGLSFILLLIPFAAFIFYFSIYLMNKASPFGEMLKWILSIGTIIILNLLWFYNFGFRGPAPYFFVIIYGVLIYVWHDKEILVVTVLLILNILIIFYLDYFHPEITESYSNHQSKVLDIYFGVFFYIGISFLVIFRAKKSYVNEYKKAKHAEMLKTSFLANMSHEIRTPLNAIVGFSNLLSEYDLPMNKRIEFKELVEENNNHLLQLINDILDISKIEAKQLNLNNNTVNLNNLLRNIYNSVLMSEKKKQNNTLKFSINTLAKDFTIETDETRTNQILTNLINNAFKFTENGEIKVSMSISEQSIVFEVSDTGIGIKKEDIEKIFERFYRIDNNNSVNKEKALYRGTGLGLYLSRNLANLLGGNLWVISEFGKGSIFYFTLPLKNYIPISSETKKITKKVNNNSASRFSHLKVLVVEDDKFNQVFFVELFKRFKIKIVLAKTGEQAVEILNDNCDFDLIFLDIKLPGIDGFEVLKQTKSMICKSFVVAQTANAMEGDERKCLDAGFDKYISKPIKKALIQKVLEDYIEKEKGTKVEDEE